MYLDHIHPSFLNSYSPLQTLPITHIHSHIVTIVSELSRLKISHHIFFDLILGVLCIVNFSLFKINFLADFFLVLIGNVRKDCRKIN